MANQSWQRSPGKGKFNYLGMNLTRPTDAMPPGRCPLLLNVAVDRQPGAIQARSGLSRVGSSTTAVTTENPVHSVIRFLDPVSGGRYVWLFGAGSKVYFQDEPNVTGSGVDPAVIGTGYSGKPLSLLPYRPPQSDSPRLYVYDSLKQAKYKSDFTEQAIGIFPPQKPPVTGLAAPQVKPITDIASSITGWTASGAASALSVVSRMPAATTIGNILYDSGSTGWCSIHPSGTSFAFVPTMYPVAILNGWSSHLADYEGGVDQGHNWITGSAGGYQNPDLAMDASSLTRASCMVQHDHSYHGCIWGFINQASTPLTGMTLSILSEIPANGTDGNSVNTRSAGIWYSLDNGLTWTQVYNAGSGTGGMAYTGRAKQWDTVVIPANQDPTKIQVMAFTDSHDDMVHYVYEINLTSSSHNAAFSFGGRLTIGSETVTVHQMFPGLANSTVGCIIYDNANWNGASGAFGNIASTPLAGLGGSGLATVQMTAPIKLDRNRLITINGNMTRVLSVTEGPDGLTSFRCSLPAGIVPGQTIVIPTSFRCYAASTHAAGDAITSNLLTAVLTTGPLASAVGLVSEPVTLDLTQINNQPLTDEDYMHVSLRFDHPENVTEVHILLDVDNQTNDFTGNYYYFAVRQNDFQGFGSADSATTTDLLDALTNEVTGNYTKGTPNTPTPDELPVGESQFYEATFKLSDLTRVGTDPVATLAAVKAIGIRVIATGAASLQFGSWWVQGTAGPDCNFNAYGNQGNPIIYRYRYRSSITGAISNPSPATRNGDLALRTGVNVAVTASADTQADLIDIERNGGTFDTWHQAMTVPNATGTYKDVTRETVAMAGDPLDTDAFPPWPVTDVPHTLGAIGGAISGCEITGTRVYCFDDFASPSLALNLKWARGTEIIVNNKVYSLYAPPDNTHSFEVNENIGILHNAAIRIPEATIMGMPLPYVCGPHDGRFFATGDPLNPGLLYFSRPYNPDTASDSGWIEITSPSEPLMSPVVFEGALYVFSSTSLYRVESTGGGVNFYQAYRMGSIASGLVAPWSFAVGPSLAWLGMDGIYLYSGAGAPENISKSDLDTLFAFGYQRIFSGGSGVFPGPVDLSRTFSGEGGSGSAMARNRLAWCDNNLYFDYRSTSGTAGATTTLVYNRLTQGWVMHSYAPSGTSDPSLMGAALHYQESKYAAEPGGVSAPTNLLGMDRFTIMAGNDGRLYFMLDGVSTDANQGIPCQVITPADDQGDSRAMKQYGDLMLDYYLGDGGGDGGGGGSFYVGVSYDFQNGYVTPPFFPAATASGGGRGQQTFDLGRDAASLHRNMTLQLGWNAAANVFLFEWQCSFFITPEDSLDRPTDWTALAGGHYVFVHGLRIDCDTGGQDRAVQIEYDGGQQGPLLLPVNHAGEEIKPYTFPPFKCHLARLLPKVAPPSPSGSSFGPGVAIDPVSGAGSEIGQQGDYYRQYGPISYGGALWAFPITQNSGTGASDGLISIYKSTDSGITWVRQDLAHAPAVAVSSSIYWDGASSAVTMLPIISAGSPATRSSVSLAGFDMATGLFGTPYAAANWYAAPAGATSSGPAADIRHANLFKLGNGHIRVVYQYFYSDTPSSNGVQEQVYYREWNGTSWSARSIFPGLTVGWNIRYQLDSAIADGDVIHCVYSQQIPALHSWYLRIAADGTFSTPLSLDAVLSADGSTGWALNTGSLSGGALLVPVAKRSPSSAIGVLRGTPKAAPSFSYIPVASAVGPQDYKIAHYASGDSYAWVDLNSASNDNSRIYSAASTDAGVTWTAPALLLDLDATPPAPVSGKDTLDIDTISLGGNLAGNPALLYTTWCAYAAGAAVPVVHADAPWRFFGADWEVDPEPEPVSYWVSQPSTFDLPGYLHIRSIQFAYASTADGGVLSVIVDGSTYTLISNLSATGGMERKIHVVTPPIKGKLWQLQAIGLDTELQIYERDCEFQVKSWGMDSYQILKPLGDTTRTSGGAKI